MTWSGETKMRTQIKNAQNKKNTEKKHGKKQKKHGKKQKKTSLKNKKNTEKNKKKHR